MGCCSSKKSDGVKLNRASSQDEFSLNIESGSFEDTYDLGRKLGAGSYATVKEGFDKTTRAKYAVKIIIKAQMEDDDHEALIQEVDILKHCTHRNIIRLFSFYDESAHYYLVTEMMEGGELFDRVVKKRTYTEQEARDVMKILLEAINYCHSNAIVHRDLKPENLLLSSPHDDAHIKIADFGFAKKCPAGRKLETQCGTPSYVAPEILTGTPYSLPVDIWSIGVINFILLGGYPPFYDDKSQAEMFKKIRNGTYSFHKQYWEKVSEDAKDLISKMLMVPPEKRITAEEALKHPWITSHQDVLSRRDLSENHKEFKKFNARRKFKAAAEAVIAVNRLAITWDHSALTAQA